jgi:HPt (histidine-containing phosphotransfer) domain-containing protein
MDDFVPKPATQKDLEAAIERWDRPFDETALANFLDVAAEAPDGRAGLLSDFLADAEARLKSARAALTQGNFEACGRDAHSIKGAAAAVGARGLADLCRRLEESADSEAGAAREAEGAALLQQADAELARLSAAASHRAAA